jgi:hypothetical protein
MSHFESIRQQLIEAVLSESTAVKNAVLEESSAAGFFDGFNQDELFVLKTIRSDIWRTRAELYISQAQTENVAA